jgi:hypothetical protein
MENFKALITIEPKIVSFNLARKFGNLYPWISSAKQALKNAYPTLYYPFIHAISVIDLITKVHSIIISLL